MAEGDATSELQALLNTGWTPANTNNRTPIIDFIENRKRINLRNQDAVFVYHVVQNSNPADLGYSSVDDTDVVTVDLRTMYQTGGRAHAILMRNEAKRVLYASRKTLTNYDYLDIFEARDLSNQAFKLWRWVLEIKCFGYNKDVT